MRDAQKKGFTIVELAVVIVVVGILAVMAVVLYSRSQMDARDTKRSSDATIMVSALEKYYLDNGEYPSSCPTGEYDTSTKLCAGRPLGFFTQSSNTPINEDTTSASLTNLLSNNVSGVRDPRDNDATRPFGVLGDLASSGRFFYLYIGTLTNNQSGSVTNVAPFQINIKGISCTYQVTVPAYGHTSFILARYSESDNKIYLRTGSQGARPSVTSPTTCELEKI
jgi:prepilin-type N-terminal cleavage/methylation domain-containing protein